MQGVGDVNDSLQRQLTSFELKPLAYARVTLSDVVSQVSFSYYGLKHNVFTTVKRS